MLGKLLPFLLLILGTGAGLGAGILLVPESNCPDDGTVTEDCPEDPQEEQAEADASEGDVPAEFARMNDQFVIPVLQDGVVRSLVVMSITLEVEAGASAAVFAIEPKLRDAFLRVLFDHANAGGFQGTYTDAIQVERLRRALLEAAQKIGGENLRNVLILDLLRQDV